MAGGLSPGAEGTGVGGRGASTLTAVGTFRLHDTGLAEKGGGASH